MNAIYWTSTLLVAAMILWSAYTYFFQPATIEGVKDLGFPDYFRIQLAVLKVIGVIVLLTPNLPMPMKEWAYAGIGLFLLTAFVAHLVHQDSIGILFILIFFFAALVVSNIYMHKLAAL